MKKVGIVTFHFANNYGAVLQCYALQKVINSFDGCEAEIVNYIPPLFTYGKNWGNEYQKKLFLKKREMFTNFLKQECEVGGLVTYKIDDAEKYDYYCVGSDQIWNTNKGFDEYFLPNLSDKVKKISYAASMGYSFDNNRLNISVMKKYLPLFDSISVRESEHVPLVESITGKSCDCVLDPTLLLSVDDYESIVGKKVLRSKPFIFFYWLQHDNNLMHGVEFANSIARKNGLQIVHSIYNAPDFMFVNDVGNMSYEGIEEFLWYIKNAEYVVTNSYHGTIFSILLQKPFYTFVVESMRSRIDTLCEKLGIEDRVVNRYVAINEVGKKINYKKIMEQLEKERHKSILYLKKSLELIDY